MRQFIDLLERFNLSQSFHEWFKGSKVVDGKGNPLPCYHGTFSTIDEFWSGTHFGDIDAANQRIDNWRNEGLPMFAGHHGAVYMVYLRILNPLRIEDDGGLDNGHDFAKEALRIGAITQEEFDRCRDGPFDHGSKVRRRLFALLQEKGYDGLVYRNTVEGSADSWVIFDPSQVWMGHQG